LIRRAIVFAPEAVADLEQLYELIADAASPATAMAYIAGVEAHLQTFETASERGTLRKDVREGLRIVGYKRRLTIAFTVTDQTVAILRIFYAGRNWAELLSEP
jgi:toxin ParE1/3/4